LKIKYHLYLNVFLMTIPLFLYILNWLYNPFCYVLFLDKVLLCHNIEIICFWYNTFFDRRGCLHSHAFFTDDEFSSLLF